MLVLFSVPSGSIWVSPSILRLRVPNSSGVYPIDEQPKLTRNSAEPGSSLEDRPRGVRENENRHYRRSNNPVSWQSTPEIVKGDSLPTVNLQPQDSDGMHSAPAE